MIVVTGAAGFIGSNLLADLEAEERGPLVMCDWLEAGEKWRNIAKRNIASFVAPETLAEFLDAHAGSLRAVVHLGAVSSTTERDVDRLVSLNIRSTLSLWDWCATRSVPFLYASSAAVYGSEEEHFLDDDAPAGTAALRPLNAYGWSKKAVDQIIANRVAAGEPAPPQWVGLRFFNVYGPNEYHKDEMRSVAVKLFEAVRRRQPVRLFKSHRCGIEDGGQRRDFVYVKDCTKAICWFLDHQDVSGIFNMGTGAARSFLELAASVGRALNCTLDVEFVDMPEAVRSQYQYYTQANMKKMRDHGMSVNFTSLEDGVADYVGRYLDQADRYR